MNEPKYECTKYKNEPNNQATNECMNQWMLRTTNKLKYEYTMRMNQTAKQMYEPINQSYASRLYIDARFWVL